MKASFVLRKTNKLCIGDIISIMNSGGHNTGWLPFRELAIITAISYDKFYSYHEIRIIRMNRRRDLIKIIRNVSCDSVWSVLRLD